VCILPSTALIPNSSVPPYGKALLYAGAGQEHRITSDVVVSGRLRLGAVG
jgi:hypothetical protein